MYLTGGATALLEGWRASTLDVDIKLDPEPEGAFEAIAKLKNELDLNVELASPDMFVPPVPGWADRSPYIATYGKIDAHHFDLLSQALAKVERGHDRDRADVEAMVQAGHFTLAELRAAFAEIQPELVRYPGIDAEAFAQKVLAFGEEKP